MPATFLALTNEVLRRINEVPLTAANFATAAGVHATVRDAVNAAVRDINQSEFEWPFNHKAVTQILTPDTALYPLPADTRSVDWDSFYLKRNDTIGTPARDLPYMDYDRWLRTRRASDDNAQSGASPAAIFRTQHNEFGVTPRPDAAYEIAFEYWGFESTLITHDQLVTIPDSYTHIIIDGALYHMYLFRQNYDSAALSEKRFRGGIAQMRTQLINRYDFVTDTRIVFGSSDW